MATRLYPKIGFLALAMIFAPLSWGKAPVQWVPGEIDYTIGDGQGASEPVVASFESSAPLDNVTFSAGELWQFVSVEPGGLTEVLPNTPYKVTLRFSIPPGTRPGTYTGTLQVCQLAIGALKPLPQALKITVHVSYGKNVVAPTTTVLSAQTVQFLSSISPDRSRLRFTNMSKELEALHVGRILILGDSPTSPGGFIGRVTAVSANGYGVVVSVAPASLADAFKSLDISISRTLSPGDVAAQSTNSTSALQPQMALSLSPAEPVSSEFVLALNHVVLYDLGGGAQVWADGSLSFSPSFTFNCSIRDFALQQLTFLDTSTLTANLSITAGLQASLSKSVTLADYPLNFITIWAGYVPIVIAPHLAVKIGIDGSVSVGLTASATQTATLTAGVQFSNGVWQPVSQFSNSFTFQQPQPSAGASVDAYAGPELQLLIYDVAGPYVAVRPNVELDINLLAEPQYQLYGGLNVAAGVVLEVLDQIIADYEDPAVISYRVLLTQGDFPRQYSYLQPGPDTGKDIWTTSVYSYAPGGSFPGGGKDDYELVVGGWGDLYYSLIQFDLGALPKVAKVARLELFCFTQRGVGTTGLYLDRITAFWDWKTQGTGRDRLRLWWADLPPAIQWIPQALPPPTVGQWYRIDITDLYNAWQNGTYPDYGLQLRPVSNNNVWAEFYSSDYTDDPSLRPKLVIEY